MGNPVHMDHHAYENSLKRNREIIRKQDRSIEALTQASTDLLNSLQNPGECPCSRCQAARMSDVVERKWPGAGTVVEIQDGSGTVIAAKEEDSSVEMVPLRVDREWENDFRTVQLVDRVANQVDLLDHKDSVIAKLKDKQRYTFYILIAWMIFSVIYPVLRAFLW